ncbi:MAG: MFS transporter [Candidatus Kariarchaeaceae archaeon]|jgi:GPH family glycoside/pentoside/hexuronide:cation symporter
MTSEEVAIHSKKTYSSFGVFMMGMNAILFITLQQYPFFYETRIGLNVGLMTLGAVIYTVWDMINDPLIGHFSDKNYGFTRRRGKRFPWIAGGIVPLIFVVILLFSPPGLDQYGETVTFVWFILFLALYDGLTSAILVNYQSLLPVKFRSDADRRNVGTVVHLFMMLGPFVGLILVGALVTSEAASFQLLAIALGAFMVITFLLSIPGLREDETLKESYFLKEQGSDPFLSELTGNIRMALREREFVLLALVTVAIAITTSLIAVSTPYYAQYVYGVSADAELGNLVAQISIPFVATTTLGIPFYFWLIRKIGHLKAFKIALVLAPLPLFLIYISFTAGSEASLPIVMLGAAIWGIFGGILQISRIPLQGDFFDTMAVRQGRRQEGMYFGLWNFFSRIVTLVMLGILAIIHTLTNFDADAVTQPLEALWGIMAHFGLIPGVILLLAALVFVRSWKLDSTAMEKVREELEATGL